MEEILEKISKIFFEYGIKSVTMDDIARELGISKKTLYQHFNDKADVVDKVLSYQLSSHKCNMEYMQALNVNAIDQILAVSRFLITFSSRIHPSVNFDLKKYYPSVWKRLMDYRQEHIYERIRNNMLKGIEEGLYRDDFNVEIIARLYSGRLEVYADSYLFGNAQIAVEELFNNIFMYHIRGIASAKGLEYIERINNKIK